MAEQPLSLADRWLILQAAVLLPITTMQLRRRGLRGYCQQESCRPAPLELATARALAQRIAALVERANRRYGRFAAGCLVKSLVLRRLLARRGIAAELRLGVRRADGGLQAHAWVEHCGVPVGDAASRFYQPLPRLIA